MAKSRRSARKLDDDDTIKVEAKDMADLVSESEKDEHRVPTMPPPPELDPNEPTPPKPGTISDPEAYAAAKAAGRIAEIPAQPELTVERALRGHGQDPILLAFIRSQYLQGRVRKQTKAEWQQEFEGFKKQKR